MKWEEILANDVTNKELISKIHKELIQLKIEGKKKKKVNASVNKWAEDLSRCFSKNTDSQQAHGKMLNIVNY